MKCSYCHTLRCLENKCLCYIVECRDGFTCSHCARCQETMLWASEPCLENNIAENLVPSIDLIYEIVEKLHLSYSIAVKTSQEYNRVKKNLFNSTKSKISLILFLLKKKCDEEGVVISLKKLCFLMKIPEQDFFATEKFLFKKIQYIRGVNFEKKCDSIFSCLQIFDPNKRHVLFLECQKLQKKTDYRIENICASIFILYKYTIDKNKIKKYFSICEEKLDVKIYSNKKLLKKYYNVTLK